MNNNYQEALSQLLARAKLGDCTSAGEAASLIYMIGTSGGLNNAVDPKGLLANAINSKDPEFLVSLGEELMHGQLLPKDPDLGLHCFKIADQISLFHGAYAIGRAYFHVDKDLSRIYFIRAANAGHFASLALLGLLNEPNTVWLKFIDKLVRFPRIIFGFVQALASADAEARFWRYKDIVSGGIGVVDSKIGIDRSVFFIQSRSIAEALPKKAEIQSRRVD